MSITADFIGGVWDGKTYEIPDTGREYRVAMIPSLSLRYINKPPDAALDIVGYDVAIYRHVVNGIFWLSRIEKR